MTRSHEEEPLPPPPLCYREAVYDDDGYMQPISTAELMDQASRWSEVRRREGLALVEEYRQPTLEWPAGKQRVVDLRLAHAIGSAEVVAALGEQLEAVEGDRRKLPTEVYLQLFTVGLMEKVPSRVTSAAIAVFHPLGLYSLLALDPVPPDKARGPIEPDREETQLRNFEDLLPTMRELGGRVLEPRLVLNVLTAIHKLLSARFVIELSRANEAAQHLAFARSMINTREAGWTKSGTQWRREKLRALVAGLRKAEPDEWPLSRVVELLLASSVDWRVPPCPELVDRYRARTNALEDLLKKDLRRGKTGRR